MRLRAATHLSSATEKNNGGRDSCSLDDTSLNPFLDAHPFLLQDRMPQPRNVLDIRFNLAIVHLLRLHSLKCHLNGSVKLLMVRFGGIDEQSNLPLDKHSAFELKEQGRIRCDRTQAFVPLVFTPRLNHQDGNKQRDQFSQHISKSFNPFLAIRRENVRIELTPCHRKCDKWPRDGHHKGSRGRN